MKFLAHVGLYLLSIPITLLGGLVLSDLWLWFIVPPFSAPPLTYLQAVGLMLTIGFFKIGLATYNLDENKEMSSIQRTITWKIFALLAYLLIWGIAWIWHLFI